MPKQIKVHEKALAHLSRGLYRSPASVLRELVSNAWDANAKTVRINTNYPNFHLLSVDDDGDGFTGEDFENLMEGGIGNSEKRVEKITLINNRPTIGRLGIGMLGIALICGAFTITSKTRDGKAFRARIKLYDLLKDQLDEEIIDKEVDIGTYDIDREFDGKKIKSGTSIVADEIHPTFTRSFQNSIKREAFVEPVFGDWNKNLKVIKKTWSLQELGDYWRLLWELSASTPIPYLDEKALPNELIKTEQAKLLEYDFKVFLDGIKLMKPVYVKGNPGGYTSLRIDHSVTVYGKELKYHGYIVVQEGLQLKPDEMRGILIRIKNVAIGYYDPSLLDYRSNEGPRSRWITGEIYVDEGLENALNIDRDSFNRFHPEFRTLQEHIHELLGEKIFPVTYTKIKKRSTKKEKQKTSDRVKHLQQVISSVTSTKVKIKTQSIKTEKTKVLDLQEKTLQTPQVNITTTESGKLEVKLPPSDSIGTKKSYRQLTGAILSIFEIAIQEKSLAKQREVFTKLLLGLLKEW
jgi:hypothetical protein